MKVTADTNVLVRAITGDDERQSGIAQKALADATAVVLVLPVLCELAWVLSKGYKTSPVDLATILRGLINGATVAVNRPAVEAGLALLDAGGDFADGVIAHEGRWFGADTFLSFDKQAAALLKARGEAVRLLA